MAPPATGGPFALPAVLKHQIFNSRSMTLGEAISSSRVSVPAWLVSPISFRQFPLRAFLNGKFPHQKGWREAGRSGRLTDLNQLD